MDRLTPTPSPYKGAVLAITGPTASGKTRKAVAAALRLHGEIISADSRQVYRGMDIGTGKDLEDYIADGCAVPYHLIDIRPAGYRYNLQEFLADYGRVERQIRSGGHVPLLCGGTGMYIENALAGVRMPAVPINEELRAALADKSLSELAAMLANLKSLHNVTDTDTRERAIRGLEIEHYYLDHPEEAARRDRSTLAPPPYLLVALTLDRERRRQLISDRLKRRFAQGMTAEVERLLASGVTPEQLIYYGLEYKFITRYVIGEISRSDMEHGLETAIHQFAKRQMTWLRGMERRGFTIHWMDAEMPDAEFSEIVAGMLTIQNQKLTDEP